MAGAVFGEVRVSLFVAGTVFGEIWNDSRSAKCCIFQYKMLVVGVKGNLGCEAGCGWSDHSRIILGSFGMKTRFESSEKGSIQSISKKGFHERFYRHIFSWFIYPLPCETSGTASRGSIW